MLIGTCPINTHTQKRFWGGLEVTDKEPTNFNKERSTVYLLTRQLYEAAAGLFDSYNQLFDELQRYRYFINKTVQDPVVLAELDVGIQNLIKLGTFNWPYINFVSQIANGMNYLVGAVNELPLVRTPMTYAPIPTNQFPPGTEKLLNLIIDSLKENDLIAAEKVVCENALNVVKQVIVNDVTELRLQVLLLALMTPVDESLKVTAARCETVRQQLLEAQSLVPLNLD